MAASNIDDETVEKKVFKKDQIIADLQAQVRQLTKQLESVQEMLPPPPEEWPTMKYKAHTEGASGLSGQQYRVVENQEAFKKLQKDTPGIDWYDAPVQK